MNGYAKDFISSFKINGLFRATTVLTILPLGLMFYSFESLSSTWAIIDFVALLILLVSVVFYNYYEEVFSVLQFIVVIYLTSTIIYLFTTIKVFGVKIDIFPDMFLMSIVTSISSLGLLGYIKRKKAKYFCQLAIIIFSLTTTTNNIIYTPNAGEAWYKQEDGARTLYSFSLKNRKDAIEAVIIKPEIIRGEVSVTATAPFQSYLEWTTTVPTTLVYKRVEYVVIRPGETLEEYERRVNSFPITIDLQLKSTGELREAVANQVATVTKISRADIGY
ncbi:hypothetical protein H6784_05325 [Candidatus Nomurabacteria bacterium]|nr:hypothetical protein [Candidatus Kaiserbacteria bacterium]MCB9814801.1 hypothetical protein [Candidatus Nomurabacteria bacterium]